ncbi:MAG: FAD-binding oxidoreductase [Haliscomenobacteraceae bacterium CHB4]|nr:FAD-binding oxidoreductase [Haliscomenobacteraceae bacterium CHB4]
MTITTRMLANWANYPVAEAEIATPENTAETRDYVLSREHLIARGNGKCYGDAALAPHVLSTLQFNRLLHFDQETGIVECEAGILLSDLLNVILPAGWFFHVTPGIKYITVGGAIASDVHGKNHPAKGCFSNWLISFELMTANGQVLTCSRTENNALFWQTCGGMGWTGIILSARFQLMKIESGQMRQTAVQAADFDSLFRAFDDNRRWSYAAGWLDGTASGRSAGRGVVFLAEHSPASPTQEMLSLPVKKPRNVPFFAPPWILNPLSIRLHNEIIFSRAKTGERLVDLDTYFYPLDRVQNWNRLYGRRGFIQYQFCLPEENSFDGIRRVMETIRNSPETPFLTVLKRHGERPHEAVHSFPIRGYSLALDFPRTRTIFNLVHQLDELVWNLGGKIYLTKDACSAARMGRVDSTAFGEEKFYSLLKARLLNSQATALKGLPV